MERVRRKYIPYQIPTRYLLLNWDFESGPGPCFFSTSQLCHSVQESQSPRQSSSPFTSSYRCVIPSRLHTNSTSIVLVLGFKAYRAPPCGATLNYNLSRLFIILFIILFIYRSYSLVFSISESIVSPPHPLPPTAAIFNYYPGLVYI